MRSCHVPGPKSMDHGGVTKMPGAEVGYRPGSVLPFCVSCTSTGVGKPSASTCSMRRTAASGSSSSAVASCETIFTDSAADPMTPVDTGMLKGNKSIEAGAGSRTITWNQEYAAYQEFGTSRGVPANGFAAAGADAAGAVIESKLGRWPG